MRFGSVCSGIEAASVAWSSLGWSAAWFAEIAPFPSKVLAHRHPQVPNVGSLVGLATRLAGPHRSIDLLVGGTPCQSFSVAGLRGGLADGRGNLALEFCRLADALRPRWVLWENVPGVLSSGEGRDFGAIVGALVELGYGVAWRVLDARYAGVPQRRRRVFLVASARGAAVAGAVLFEPEGVRRNPSPFSEAREDSAGAPEGGADGRALRRPAGFVPSHAKCLTTSAQRIDTETETFVATCFNARQDPLTYGSGTGPLDTHGSTYGVCVTGEQTHALRAIGSDASEDGTGRGTPITVAMRGRAGGATAELGGEQANALRAATGGGSAPFVLETRVRRLTPTECERLQGFPDGYTAIPGAKDGPRYAALGNSMAVPVMRWIGERIAKVDALLEAA